MGWETCSGWETCEIVYARVYCSKHVPLRGIVKLLQVLQSGRILSKQCTEVLITLLKSLRPFCPLHVFTPQFGCDGPKLGFVRSNDVCRHICSKSNNNMALQNSVHHCNCRHVRTYSICYVKRKLTQYLRAPSMIILILSG